MLIYRFYPVIGGAERSLQRLCGYLTGKGCRVTVVTKREPGLRKKELIDNVPVYRLLPFGKGYKGKFLHLCYTFAVLFFLIRNNREFDIVHIHGADPYASAASLLAKLTGKKVILKIATGGKGGDISGFRGSFLGGLQKFLFKRFVDIYIGMTEQIKNELLEEGFDRRKIRQIPNGVDTDFFRPEAEKKDLIKDKLSLKKESRILIFAGRLVERKGVDSLIKAFASMRTASGNPVLIIAGTGDMEAALKELASDVKVSERVRFAREVHNIEDYYKCADLFILPSESEGLPNSLLEAMSSSVAAVVSDIPGMRELIKDSGAGILVNPRDIENFAERIAALIADVEKCRDMGQRGREYVKDNFGLESVGERYIKLYGELKK
jgi:glycosyltransferase involved in cell wall biosynthesis